MLNVPSSLFFGTLSVLFVWCLFVWLVLRNPAPKQSITGKKKSNMSEQVIECFHCRIRMEPPYRARRKNNTCDIFVFVCVECDERITRETKSAPS